MEPTEITMPNEDRLTQVSCGNTFTVGISLPLKSQRSGSGTFIPSSVIMHQISRGCALDAVHFESGDVSTIQQTVSTLDKIDLTSFQPTPLKTDTIQSSSTTDSLYTATIVPRQDRFTFDTCSFGVCKRLSIYIGKLYLSLSPCLTNNLDQNQRVAIHTLYP